MLWSNQAHIPSAVSDWSMMTPIATYSQNTDCRIWTSACMKIR
jgi:hypothetical protein